MDIAVFQHEDHEGPGYIGTWAQQQGLALHTFRTDQGQWPQAEPKLLVVMGGTMSANDGDRLPWLAQELEYVGAWLAAGKPCLGVCLGSQLMAKAAGGRVYKGPQQEIGWYPVTPQGHEPWLQAWGTDQTVFHWHGETFDLPPGAQLLFSNSAYRHQGFRLADHQVGLQFHIEMDDTTWAEWFPYLRRESGPGVQDVMELTGGRRHMKHVHPLLHRLLDHLWARA